MNPFRRRLLWVSTLVTAITGVVYWWMATFLEPVSEWAVINHPLQPWMLKAHILAAPVMLFAVGMITWDHIWRHIRSGLPRGRKSGLVITAVFGPLVLTGYLLQTVTGEGVTALLSWSHLVLGTVCTLFIGTHRRVLRGDRKLRRRSSLPVVREDQRRPDEPGRAELRLAEEPVPGDEPAAGDDPAADSYSVAGVPPPR